MATTFSAQHLSRITRRMPTLSVVDTVIVPATTVLTTDDILNLCTIPAFSVLAAIWIKVPDLDSGGPTLTMSVRDNVVPTVYLVDSTVGQAGGYITTDDLTTLGIVYSTEALLQLIVTASATAAQSTAQTISFAALFALTKA